MLVNLFVTYNNNIFIIKLSAISHYHEMNDAIVEICAMT